MSSTSATYASHLRMTAAIVEVVVSNDAKYRNDPYWTTELPNNLRKAAEECLRPDMVERFRASCNNYDNSIVCFIHFREIRQTLE